MSRNLCTSSCVECGQTVRLSDVRGKPIEFRRYAKYAPAIGCRWDCPCGQVYFVIWRHKDTHWGKELLEHAHKDEFPAHSMIGVPEEHRKNRNKGRFYVDSDHSDFQDLESLLEEGNHTNRHETGTFTLDLSYYESYNDEPMWDNGVKDGVHGTRTEAVRNGVLPPHHLCEDDALDVQLEW